MLRLGDLVDLDLFEWALAVSGCQTGGRILIGVYFNIRTMVGFRDHLLKVRALNSRIYRRTSISPIYIRIIV